MPTESGPFPFRCAPKPPLAIPARRCHAAALHPPVGASRQSPHSFPPIEETVIAIQSVGCLLYIVCDAMPTPGRCTVRRCTDSAPAVGQPLRSLRVTCGLGQGQVGLLSAVQAPQQKACRSVPTRHLPFALILMQALRVPSVPLADKPSVTRRIVNTAHRHHYSPRLDKSAPRKIGAVAKVNFHVAEI